MGMKIMIEIQGNLYDWWEVRSLERGIRYNELDEKSEYLIILNKTSLTTNVSEIVFVYETEEKRDEELANIKSKLVDSDSVLII